MRVPIVTKNNGGATPNSIKEEKGGIPMKHLKNVLWSVGAIFFLCIAGSLMALSVMFAKKPMSVAAAVGVMMLLAYFILTASVLFEEKAAKMVMNVFVITIPTGFCFYWATGVFPAWGVILGALACAAMIYVVIWWSQEGSAIKEFLIFVVIDAILASTAASGIARIYDLTEIRWVIGILKAIPWILYVMSVGYFLFDIIQFKQDLGSEDFDPYDYLDEEEVG